MFIEIASVALSSGGIIAAWFFGVRFCVRRVELLDLELDAERRKSSWLEGERDVARQACLIAERQLSLMRDVWKYDARDTIPDVEEEESRVPTERRIVPSVPSGRASGHRAPTVEPVVRESTADLDGPPIAAFAPTPVSIPAPPRVPGRILKKRTPSFTVGFAPAPLRVTPLPMPAVTAPSKASAR